MSRRIGGAMTEEGMSNELIGRTVKRYRRQNLLLTVAVALTALLLLGSTAGWTTRTLADIGIGALFSVLTAVAYGAAWQSLAKQSPGVLAKFYLTAPVVRLLLALVVMLAYYAVSSQTAGGKPAMRAVMLSFTAIFFAFYIVQMIFESIYFSRVEKQNKI